MLSKPYEFIGFGAIDVTEPYKFTGFGVIDVPKPYEFIGFGDNAQRFSRPDQKGPGSSCGSGRRARTHVQNSYFLLNPIGANRGLIGGLIGA